MARNKTLEDRSLPEILDFWKDLLENPELVDKAVIFQDDRGDYRIVEGIRLWPTHQRWVNFANAHKWKLAPPRYKVAIPIGGKRKAGVEGCFIEPQLSSAMEELAKRPTDFPNLRHAPSSVGNTRDIWWGEDITNLWAHKRTLENHHALGRAFGYREDRIFELYPHTWLGRFLKLWRRR